MKKLLIFEFIISWIGIIIMFFIDWKMAIGITLLIWGNNLMIFRRIKE